MKVTKGELVVIQAGEFKGELGCIHEIVLNTAFVKVDGINEMVRYRLNEVRPLCLK
jgi:ribosomal protein L24